VRVGQVRPCPKKQRLNNDCIAGILEDDRLVQENPAPVALLVCAELKGVALGLFSRRLFFFA
jgi:hypothetical protein